jgi:hypothetical protein
MQVGQQSQRLRLRQHLHLRLHQPRMIHMPA